MRWKRSGLIASPSYALPWSEKLPYLSGRPRMVDQRGTDGQQLVSSSVPMPAEDRPCLSRSYAGLLGNGDDAELLQQAELIPVEPVLRPLAVLEAGHDHAGDESLVAGGWDAQQLTVLGATGGKADRHL